MKGPSAAALGLFEISSAFHRPMAGCPSLVTAVAVNVAASVLEVATTPCLQPVSPKIPRSDSPTSLRGCVRSRVCG